VTRKSPKDAPPERPIATNRQARFRFELLDRHEAGLVLMGSEVKALREGNVNMSDAYVRFKNGEAYLSHCHVGPYSHANAFAHEALRERKLLMRRVEIDKLERAVAQKGLTVVPTRIYFSGSRVKIEIALARGKKTEDKRETIKQRDMDRRARRGDHD
jgi:SsrA-binding protein